MNDERLDDDIARRHREELAAQDSRSHAFEFECSGEHDEISGACLPAEIED